MKAEVEEGKEKEQKQGLGLDPQDDDGGCLRRGSSGSCSSGRANVICS